MALGGMCRSAYGSRFCNVVQGSPCVGTPVSDKEDSFDICGGIKPSAREGALFKWGPRAAVLTASFENLPRPQSSCLHGMLLPCPCKDLRTIRARAKQPSILSLKDAVPSSLFLSFHREGSTLGRLPETPAVPALPFHKVQPRGK